MYRAQRTKKNCRNRRN
uniref:Uncharacterized protein n=1 Tax=Arundo donax TaxID=35708 RepID=A0A0A9H9X4_ARUDO